MISSDGLPARRAAFYILQDILHHRQPLDEAFAKSKLLPSLPARDRGFVRVLVTTVLKRTGEIDALLRQLLHDPLEKISPPALLNILRLGIAQLAFLETPPHAAVSTSVDLTHAEKFHHHKNLVNAVLRRFVREKPSIPVDTLNTPAWLWQTWISDYGFDTAQSIAQSHLNTSPIDFSVKETPEKWAQLLDAEILPTGSLRKFEVSFIPDLPGFQEGSWWIQNAAAALPARLFGPIAGKTIVDLCAAPGGKTAQLSAQAAKTIAVDRAASRLARLEENLTRLSLQADIIKADGTTWQPSVPVDGVLVDAPCTATGTIRHQPDILHLKTSDDQKRLIDTQRKLLCNAVKMLKPGGTLIYCTCSLQKDESEYQTTWILEQGFPLQLWPITANDLPGIEPFLTKRGEIRCLPSQWAEKGGLDGFYVARFQRF